MKTLLTMTIFILTTFGCANKQISKDDKLPMPETQENTDKLFKQVADFPIIRDTSKFIADLRQTFELEVDESPVQKANEKITTYQKVKIYGSDNNYLFIEYDYGSGSMVSYPWKYQLLLKADGSLVKVLSGQRFDFVEIFPSQNPFLLTVTATAKGNGGHEIYKISADTLENVYEGYYDYGVQTYDAHEDNKIYAPHELILKVKDLNNDKFNDISFNGKILFIQGQTKCGVWFDSETIDGKTVTYSVNNPFKKIPVEFVFVYDKQTRHFKAKENYREKYGLEN